jgi:hypothetical protein
MMNCGEPVGVGTAESSDRRALQKAKEPGSPRGRNRKSLTWRARAMMNCGEPVGVGTVESPDRRALQKAKEPGSPRGRSRRPLTWRARAMMNCGEPSGAGTVESPTAGLSKSHGELWRARRGRHRGEPDRRLSKRPRDRALYAAGVASPCPGEPAPGTTAESPAKEAPWRARPPDSPQAQGSGLSTRERTANPRRGESVLRTALHVNKTCAGLFRLGGPGLSDYRHWLA